MSQQRMVPLYARLLAGVLGSGFLLFGVVLLVVTVIGAIGGSPVLPSVGGLVLLPIGCVVIGFIMLHAAWTGLDPYTGEDDEDDEVTE